MSIAFATRTDLLEYVRTEIQNFDLSEERYDSACERFTDAIKWHGEGMDWGRSYSEEEWEDILDGVTGGKDLGEYILSLVDDKSDDDDAPAYTITADHEYGDPDYHCATLTVGDMEWSYTRGDIDLGDNTLTYRQAIAARIIDNPDDVDEDDIDNVISDRYAFVRSVREEIEDASIQAENDYADAEIAAKADEAAEDIDDYAKFLWWSPRGFANECVLYGIKGDDVDEAEAWLDDADPAQSKWGWMDAEEAREELRDGIENAVNLGRGFGADNPPCGVTKIIPWSERNA